jgi:hypothetical protein
MFISSCCGICQERHCYDMYQVVDVVRFPERKQKLISGKLAPFKCPTCDNPTGLENRVFFAYWAKSWVGDPNEGWIFSCSGYDICRISYFSHKTEQKIFT